MNCKAITERLKRVAAIVDSWKDESGVPQIERDIALSELRDIYNALLVVDSEGLDNVEIEDTIEREEEVEVEVVIEAPAEEESAPKSDVGSIESFYDALDIDALLGLTDESVADSMPEPKVVEEPEAEPIPEPVAELIPEPMVEPEPVVEEPAPEPTPEPVAEEPKPVGAGLFDLNDIPVRSKSRRKMISLYSDNPTPAQIPAEPVKQESVPVEPVVAPKVEEAPVAETALVAPQQRLGDTFGEVKTLADQMAKNDAPTTPFNRITELRQAIGLNDKFLMIRDLFGGDAARYEATIDTLDEFDDLDECIIYIVENFRWNPDLEAAKLLVSLIERKLA
jgi:hypothetical protein